MLAQARITRRSVSLLATMASIVSWDNSALEAGQIPMGEHLREILPLPEDLAEVARMEMQARRVVLQVEFLIPERLVCCGSSTNHWEGRLSGCCRWQYLEHSRLPGRDARGCKATANSNPWCCGARGCSRWVSSLASPASSISTT